MSSPPRARTPAPRRPAAGHPPTPAGATAARARQPPTTRAGQPPTSFAGPRLPRHGSDPAHDVRANTHRAELALRAGSVAGHAPVNARGPRRPPPAVTPPWRAGLHRFVRRHGWRAYALPILVVVTIVALTSAMSTKHGPAAAGVRLTGHLQNLAAPASAQPPPGGADAPTPAGSVAPGPTSGAATGPTASRAVPPGTASGKVKVAVPGQSEDAAADALPAGPKYTKRGAGTFRALPGTSPVVGTGPLRTYVIEVENGLTGVDLGAFQTLVVATLSDGRSWSRNQSVSLRRVASDAAADFRVTLTSSMTIRALCGYEQKIETSCWEDSHGASRVNLNVARWVRGDTQFGQDLASYRLYMINHEVGHAIGHGHTFTCLPNGLAPVMMQQTITLKENNGQGSTTCRPNAWPYPPGIDPAVAVRS